MLACVSTGGETAICELGAMIRAATIIATSSIRNVAGHVRGDAALMVILVWLTQM
jgi:hypothetical protein